MSAPVGFAGMTHLGILYGTATAAKGFPVVSFDPDPTLGERLRRGDFPVNEPGLAECWAGARDRLGYTAEAEALRACPLVFISLDVPTSDAHTSDLEPLRTLIAAVVPQLASGATLVLLNQVPPGFTQGIGETYREMFASRGVTLIYQVETLIFGRAVERALQPERYIIGLADPASALPPAYRAWLDAFDCPLVPMRYASAELAKTAINFFLVSTVTTTNLLAELCEHIGADWAEIVPALQLDKRIGPHAYLKPGLGISGGNLPRDLVTLRDLSQKYGTEARTIDAWIADSDYRRDWVLRKLLREKPSTVAVWGLAYIANTASTKNSAAVALIRALAGEGVAIRAFDPRVASLPEGCAGTVAASALEALDGADLLVVMTPWPEFAQIPPAQIAARLGNHQGKTVLDPLGLLDEAACRAAGLVVNRIGKAP